MHRRVKVGILGCGSVSRHYLKHLAQCPYADVVSVGDLATDRAERVARDCGIPNVYSDAGAMLACAPIDLVVNLTDMQSHERLNRLAIEAGKHVWSEKPFANTSAAGQELVRLARSRGVRIWGAPTVVQSPQFACMAEALNRGTLGKVAAATAAYGHLGPDWAGFFYTRQGGSLPDLGVYNLTFLTGLLGPARSVVAMTSIVSPRRNILGTGDIEVTEEDNAMVLLEHAEGVLSHVACGFNYFDPEDHAHTGDERHTISVIGRAGTMRLVGFDWAPKAVDISTQDHPTPVRYADGPHEYVWENGASLAAECLATGREPRFTIEHALHVVEIIEAARQSQRSGARIALKSTFDWPITGPPA